ncbi:hypothetical protein Efla_006983 [Eimeria flavescens]
MVGSRHREKWALSMFGVAGNRAKSLSAVGSTQLETSHSRGAGDAAQIAEELDRSTQPLAEVQRVNQRMQEELKKSRRHQTDWYRERLLLEQTNRELLVVESDAARVSGLEQHALELKVQKCAFAQAQLNEVKARTEVAGLQASFREAHTVTRMLNAELNRHHLLEIYQEEVTNGLKDSKNPTLNPFSYTPKRLSSPQAATLEKQDSQPSFGCSDDNNGLDKHDLKTSGVGEETRS